jgi:hypothetical protein
MNAAAVIVLIKALHTAVFLFASGCILYALSCGITGRASRVWLRPAIAVPTGIGVLWWLNGRECLLSSVIYRLADGDHTVSDIFLPDAVASRIMPVSTTLLALAVGLILWRLFTRRWKL